MPATYRATEYLRLSYANDHSGESDSISNQKKLVQDFLANHPDIQLVSTQVDDGYSGVIFDRPAFQAMMRDIREGKVNCVIVKDLSRLGREYIETGNYLTHTFPAFGVRFISINDGVDAANEKAGDDITVSIKNIINDAYSHDISVKTRSALQIKRKNGDYVGSCPVYGYRKDPENRNRLVIDEDAASVVREIYRRKLDGESSKRISEELNQTGVLSPMAYKIAHGLPHPSGGFGDNPDSQWSPQTVIRILQDETYTGTLVQGRQGTYNHKIKDVVTKPAEEWVRVEHTHDAIIQRRDFDLVQKVLRLDTRTAPSGKDVYLFSGLLICGCCGGQMTRKINVYKNTRYAYYYCRTGKKHGCAHPVMLKEDDLIQCVLAIVQAHIRSVVSLDELLDSLGMESLSQSIMDEYRERIGENQLRLERAGRFKTTLYENYISGHLSKSEYKEMKDHYSAEMDEAQKNIVKLREELDQTVTNTSGRMRWAEQFKEFSTMTTLDRRAVVALIDSIRVLGKKELEIKFRYQLEFDRAKAMAAHCPSERIPQGIGEGA